MPFEPYIRRDKVAPLTRGIASIQKSGSDYVINVHEDDLKAASINARTAIICDTEAGAIGLCDPARSPQSSNYLTTRHGERKTRRIKASSAVQHMLRHGLGQPGRYRCRIAEDCTLHIDLKGGIK